MRRLFAFLLALTLPVPGFACAWDYDTLQMERQRFPGALELIVGKFLRHSDTFYEWRVKDRQRKIAAHDTDIEKLSDEELAAAYNDLAVAFDKLGKHDEAIKTIREKAERLPNIGQYETHANLGTFLVHSGKLEDGLAELRKAIEINPESHFGREKYQIRLVEYVIEKRGSDAVVSLPLAPDAGSRFEFVAPFAGSLLEKEGISYHDSPKAAQAELSRATKGLLGMMRFGNFRSPVLLEALGDVLYSNRGENVQSQRLAGRAYLRAAEFASDEGAEQAYREIARYSVMTQYPEAGRRETYAAEAGEEGMGLSLASLEDQLAREVKEADAWFKEVAHDEELWVVASPDPDKRFWEKYGNQTITVGHDRLPAGKFAAKGLPVILRIALGAGLALTVLVVIAAMIWRKRQSTGYESVETTGQQRE